MEERREIKFFKIDDVRQATIADSFYAIKGKNDTTTRLAITDKDGNVFFAQGGSSGVVSDHNLLLNLQGGVIPNEFYHLSENQYNQMLELLYTNNEVSFTIIPSSGERGVITTLTLNYNIKSNDDEITSATINNGIGSVFQDADDGEKIMDVGTSTTTKTYVLTLGILRGGLSISETISTTYNAYIPQFAGVSGMTDFTTYASMLSSLTKFVQATPNIVKVSSPTDEYIWFISTKQNATVLDQNNFQQTVGIFGNTTTEFYTKPLIILLADGVTTSTVYVYRSRNKKTLSNFGYKIQ